MQSTANADHCLVADFDKQPRGVDLVDEQQRLCLHDCLFLLVGEAPSLRLVGYLFELMDEGTATNEMIRVLSGSELALEQGAAAALATHMRPVPLRRGEFLFLQGEPCDRFFIVSKGSLEIQASSTTGRELVFGALGPGSPIGEVSIFDETPRSAGIRAAIDSEVLAIGREVFLRLVAEHPSIGLWLARHLARSVRRLSENVEGTSFLPLSKRLADLVCALALQAGNPADGHWRIVVTQQQLADRLGSSRESVNKLLGGWSSAGLLEIRRGALEVPDGAALRASAES